MSYTKQNFTDGQTLTAAMLNHIESGIVQHDSELAQKQPKGDYLTKNEAAESYQPKGDYASTAYIAGIFEELKALIQAGDTDAAIAVLDNAILDMVVLA